MPINMILNPRNAPNKLQMVSKGPNHIKYDDGTLIQWGRVDNIDLGTYNTETEPGVYRTNTRAPNFPIPFTSRPYVYRNITRISGPIGTLVLNSKASSTSLGSFMFTKGSRSTASLIVELEWLAIGGGVIDKLLNLLRRWLSWQTS